MSNFQGVTFAFSHKNKVWRTRYSFTPTAYAYVDNFFLSTNGRHPSSSNTNETLSNAFWLHDASSIHNRFYGFQYDTSLAFVSNYSPSAVKMFKSLSVESNSNSWSGFVTTNNNPMGSDQTEYQVGTLGSFSRKEGSSYVDIPPSESNSTANVNTAFSAAGGISYNMIFDDASEIGLSPANPLLTWAVDIDTQYGQITAGKNCFVLISTEEGLAYIKAGEIVPIGNGVPRHEDGYAYIESFDADTNTVNISMKIPVEQIAQYPFVWMDEPYETVYISTPSKTNGDYMRGHYLNVYLNNVSTKPIECLSFNVNYEPTKLDHSLGQNA